VDLKIETPRPGDARLPDVVRFVVLLGVERGVAEVLRKELKFPIEGALNLGRSAPILPARPFSETNLHLRLFRLFAAPVEESDRFLGGAERTVDPPLADVLQGAVLGLLGVRFEALSPEAAALAGRLWRESRVARPLARDRVVADFLRQHPLRGQQ
jgi:hypothetical protein